MWSRDHSRLPSSGFSSTLDPIAEVNALHQQLRNMDKSNFPQSKADRARRKKFQEALDKWEGSREYAAALDASGQSSHVDPSAPFWHQPAPARREEVEDHRSGSQRWRDFLATQQPVPSLSLHPASPLSASTPINSMSNFSQNLYSPQRRDSSNSSSSSASASSLSLSPENQRRGRSRGNSNASSNGDDGLSVSERTEMPLMTRSMKDRVFRRLTPSRGRERSRDGRQGSFMSTSS